MTTFTTGAALVAVATTALIYGTDLFCALVLRPAGAGAADSSVADLLGRVHEYGDRRLPAPGVISMIATALATVTSDTSSARVGGTIALAALLAWLAIYARISAPINKRLRAAAANHTTPPDTRALQQRWDSVIWTRALLQAVALTGVLTILLTR
jgi:Anthrone oxygenase